MAFNFFIFMASILSTLLLSLLQGGLNDLFNFSSMYLTDFIKVSFTSSFLEELVKFGYLALIFRPIVTKKEFTINIYHILTFFFAFISVETFFYISNEGIAILPQRFLLSIPLHLLTLFILLLGFWTNKKILAFLKAWGIHFIINFMLISGNWLISYLRIRGSAIEILCFFLAFMIVWSYIIITSISLIKKYKSLK